AHYLAAHRARLDRLSFDDACATLAAFSAEAIARGTRHLVAGRAIVSGGGVHNRGLMAHLRKRVAPGIEIVRSDAAGVDPDFKEALAFAVLGYETLRGRPAGVPAATGAAHAAVLGAIVPFALSQLLAKVEREIAESVTR
ncbi:MAG: anhydro-N-acetylmuramic acid kinase, partial [Candidatus Eremiobacteraeota bacterium]|nr:anhydro-N-acetylmuramic acid kinase [Candidatus Eremiobacteraeota bacterium]